MIRVIPKKKRKLKRWSDEEDRFIRDNYLSLRTDEIADLLNRGYMSVSHRARQLGILKVALLQQIQWSEEETKFLADNFLSMTAAELAAALGKSRTIVRMKYRALGLKKYDLEFWTPEQVAYLKANYKTIGDTELAELFNGTWAKGKGWTKKHIEKKRQSLRLNRTQSQKRLIMRKNCEPGGPNDTIGQNSASVNMSDKWVAMNIAWRNKTLQNEILDKHPQLITLKRTQLLLNREIKSLNK